MHTKALFSILGALAVVATLVYAVGFVRGSGSSAEALARRALGSGTTAEKEQAAAELIGLGVAAIPQMRQVLSQSDVPQVRAACIVGLGAVFDYDSMTVILESLDDESSLVRDRATVAASRMLGCDYGISANIPEDQRARRVAAMWARWEELQGTEMLEDIKKRMLQQVQQRAESGST